MAPYCEDGAMRGVTVYELYSVVIHSGSTHSGHYTAYIRDVDRLGSWTSPVSEALEAGLQFHTMHAMQGGECACT